MLYPEEVLTMLGEGVAYESEDGRMIFSAEWAEVEDPRIKDVYEGGLRWLKLQLLPLNLKPPLLTHRSSDPWP